MKTVTEVSRSVPLRPLLTMFLPAAAAFLLTGGALDGLYSPWSLAVVSAAGVGWPGLSALLGAGLGAFLFLDFQAGLRHTASAILIFCAATAFCTTRLYRRPRFRPAAAVVMTLLVQSAYLFQRQPRQWTLCAAALTILWAAAALLPSLTDSSADGGTRQQAGFLLALGLSTALDLRAVKYILSHVVDWGILALIILFQPEIRQILERLGSKNLRLMRVFRSEEEITEVEKAIDQTVMACSEMSRTRTGVLMVFERNINLDDIVRTGTELDCEVVCELLKNIFFVKAPMHDGAVIVRHGRIVGGGCMLPLSKNVNLSRDLGMRHRAGIGMSENSDAVVVIVSEETGSISVAIGGMLKRHLMPETLGKLLRNELMPPEEEADKPQRVPVLAFLKKLGKEADDDGEEE